MFRNRSSVQSAGFKDPQALSCAVTFAFRQATSPSQPVNAASSRTSRSTSTSIAIRARAGDGSAAGPASAAACCCCLSFPFGDNGDNGDNGEGAHWESFSTTTATFRANAFPELWHNDLCVWFVQGGSGARWIFWRDGALPCQLVHSPYSEPSCRYTRISPTLEYSPNHAITMFASTSVRPFSSRFVKASANSSGPWTRQRPKSSVIFAFDRNVE